MAEVLSASEENLDYRLEKSTDEKPPEDAPSDAAPGDSSPLPPPQPPRRGIRERERDSGDRRDDRDYDRPPRREYYDRNRSPPRPPPRERDYHKRGRMSPSPPPPPYRDRRGGDPHSPPPRRSPPFPPYKRRRDDGYDGRRGSPRGGYGPGDRRFGYDYPSGYDRNNGGRSGPDKRSHGRYMGRGGGGYQDWDSGRGADSFGAGGTQREGMMSYKQFIQELEDDILPSEAERRYQEYRTEYISIQKQTYFNAHKDEWLKDKYHPTNLLSVIEREAQRNELARKLAKDFQHDLETGTLDIGPAFSPSSSPIEAQQPSEPNSEDETDTSGKRRRPNRGGTKESDLSLLQRLTQYVQRLDELKLTLN